MDHSRLVVEKKIRWVAAAMITLCLCMTLIPISLFGYYKYNVGVLKDETYTHLSTEGYSEDDIKNVQVVMKKIPLLSTLVEFTDEQGVIYWYDKKQGEIVQIGIYESPGIPEEQHFKHLE
ncbi:hypothetical protein [Falsibacillus pallidus]|uniref:DUF3139 domain-containing protein n=1 Tax=Falsibacillus pallidus TaxID=493781 RepID=A0A370FXU5_9BACI|nr:hypothetical protein [Falsibacillus pallidus]RDI36437.1 hypothetical protein DFR59_1317 [Falsibacillus pallidus]